MSAAFIGLVVRIALKTPKLINATPCGTLIGRVADVVQSELHLVDGKYSRFLDLTAIHLTLPKYRPRLGKAAYGICPLMWSMARK